MHTFVFQDTVNDIDIYASDNDPSPPAGAG